MQTNLQLAITACKLANLQLQTRELTIIECSLSHKNLDLYTKPYTATNLQTTLITFFVIAGYTSESNNDEMRDKS